RTAAGGHTRPRPGAAVLLSCTGLRRGQQLCLLAPGGAAPVPHRFRAVGPPARLLQTAVRRHRRLHSPDPRRRHSIWTTIGHPKLDLTADHNGGYSRTQRSPRPSLSVISKLGSRTGVPLVLILWPSLLGPCLLQPQPPQAALAHVTQI